MYLSDHESERDRIPVQMWIRQRSTRTTVIEVEYEDRPPVNIKVGSRSQKTAALIEEIDRVLDENEEVMKNVR